MKAILISRYGGLEVLERRELPQPQAKAHEVVVRVHATSVNPIDWKIREGLLKFFIRTRFPMILGVDFAGEVAAIGAQVRGVALGERVFAMMPKDYGAYAEYVAIDSDLVVRKPDSMSMEEAASVPATALTALQALRDMGRVGPGAAVLVNGATGGVGVFGLQIAKALGASSVVAVCSEAGSALARSLGATEVIDYKTADFASARGRYDVIFDAVGNRSFAACKPALRSSGAYVTTNPAPSVIARQLLNAVCRKRAYGIIVKSRRRDLEYVKSLIDEGRVRTVIDRVFPSAEVAQAQAYSATGRAKGKIVLRFAD